MFSASRSSRFLNTPQWVVQSDQRSLLAIIQVLRPGEKMSNAETTLWFSIMPDQDQLWGRSTFMAGHDALL